MDISSLLVVNNLSSSFYQLTNPIIKKIARTHKKDLTMHPTTKTIIQLDSWRKAGIIYDGCSTKSFFSYAVVDIYLNIKYVVKIKIPKNNLKYLQ